MLVAFQYKQLHIRREKHQARSIQVGALRDTSTNLDPIPEALHVKRFRSVPLRQGIQSVKAISSSIVSIWISNASIDSVAKNKGTGQWPHQFTFWAILKRPNERSYCSNEASNFLTASVTLPARSGQCFDRRTTYQRSKASGFDPAHEWEPDDFLRSVPANGWTTLPLSFKWRRLTSGNERIPPTVSTVLLSKVKTELDAMEEANIIRRIFKPTAWVRTPFLVWMKKNNNIRLVIDFCELNDYIIRPNFKTPAPCQAVRTIPPGMNFFTVIEDIMSVQRISWGSAAWQLHQPRHLFYPIWTLPVFAAPVWCKARWRWLLSVSIGSIRRLLNAGASTKVL